MRGYRDGFSLMETLVAMAILASMASVAITVMATSIERSAQALGRIRAVFAAEALFNLVGLDLPLEPEVQVKPKGLHSNSVRFVTLRLEGFPQ